MLYSQYYHACELAILGLTDYCPSMLVNYFLKSHLSGVEVVELQLHQQFLMTTVFVNILKLGFCCICNAHTDLQSTQHLDLLF